MFLAFLILLMFNGAVGVAVFYAWRRISAYLRSNPESARIFSECVVLPLLTGRTDKPEPKPEVKPEPKKIKGATLV